MSLYSLTSDILELEMAIDALSDDADLSEAVRGYLDGVQDGELSTKLENYVKYERSLRAEAEMFGNEAAELVKLQKQRTGRADSLRRGLHEFFERTGRTEVKAGMFTLKKISNGGKRPMLPPPVIDFDKLKDLGFAELVEQDPVWNVDRAAIYIKLDEGTEQEVAGFRLGEREWRVEVR